MAGLLLFPFIVQTPSCHFFFRPGASSLEAVFCSFNEFFSKNVWFFSLFPISVHCPYNSTVVALTILLLVQFLFHPIFKLPYLFVYQILVSNQTLRLLVLCLIMLPVYQLFGRFFCHKMS